MNYGLTFSKALEAYDTSLSQWDSSVESAMEASTPKTQTITQQGQQSDVGIQSSEPTSAENPQATIENMVTQITNMTEKITKTYDSISQRCDRFLNNTWNDNEKFIEQYAALKRDYKLVDKLTVINWTYGHDMEQYLHYKCVKLRSIITNNTTYLSNWQNTPKDALINLSGAALDKELVAQLGAPSSIETSNEFMGHLRSQFRGRKGDKTYRGEMADRFIQDVRNFARTKTSYSQDMGAANRAIKNIDSILKAQVRNSHLDNNARRNIIKMGQTLYRMIAHYLNLIYFVYQLQAEYILNRVAIINRLYEK